MTTRTHRRMKAARGTLTAAVAVFALALAGCGGPDDAELDRDMTREEPASDPGFVEESAEPAPPPEPQISQPQTNEQLPADETESQFTALDTNADDRITEDEWLSEPIADTQFSEADSDGDGAVNQQELREALEGDDGAMESSTSEFATEFAALDTDGNGELAQNEWKPEMLNDTPFEEADQDGDDAVDRQEFDEAVTAGSK